MKKNFDATNYQVLLPLSIIMIITLMIVTLSISFIKIDAISKKMIANNYQNSINSDLLKTMSESSLDRAILLNKMVQSEDAFELDEMNLENNILATTFTVAREKLIKQNLSDEQIELLEEQSAIARRVGALGQKIYDYLLQERYEEAKSIFYSTTVEKRYKNIKVVEEIYNLQYKIGQDTFNQLKNESNQTLKTILASVISTILVCIGLTIMIIRHQKVSHSKLTELANSDALTGLPNRSKLISSIEDAIENDPDKPFALIFLDIDYFKSINDNYGHDVGDEILKQFSVKITDSISSTDILSRFGGDEFVIFLRNISSEKAAVDVTRSISKSLDTSFIINNKEIFTSSSIGITIYSPDGDCTDAKLLLSQADNAMYLAKKSGRNCFYLFSKETHKLMQKEHTISHDLHSILQSNNKDNQLNIIYQPIYNLNNLKVSGFEALIRWKNKDGIFISPEEFIPIAEKTNLIEKINLLVIKEVCLQKAKWNKSTKRPSARINFNLSGNKKSFDFLLNEFKQQISLHDLNYSDFGIELTERTILEVEGETANKMLELTQQGLKILIDDFGTGYSSLSYLKKLPITTIKIDKSFISGLPHDKDDNELVKTIITLGKSFKLDIIAEGVETKEQLDYLQNHSCQLAQGYYLNKPMNINEINKLKQTDYAKVA